jgi:hypothetical protein
MFARFSNSMPHAVVLKLCAVIFPIDHIPALALILTGSEGTE